MTPEEKFNSEVWWVLQQLKYLKISSTGELVEFVIKIRPIPESGLPLVNAQEKALLKVEEFGGIKIVECGVNDFWYGKDYIWTIKFLQPKFDELYKTYEHSCDVNAWANFVQEKNVQNLKSGKDIDENVPEFLEVEKDLHLSTADRKKLCVLEKLKEEHDLTPKTAVRTHIYFGYSHVRPAGEAWLYEQKLLTWIQECNLSDRLELENILAIFQQEGLVSKFIYSEQEGNLKIQFPEEFEGWYDKYKKKNVILPPPLSDNFDTTRRAHTVAIKKELEKEDLIKEVISRIPKYEGSFNRADTQIRALKLFSDMTTPPELQQAEQTRLLKEISKKLETKDIANKQSPTQQEKISIPDVFTISIQDRKILINNYLISKPHAVGSNFEFFEYIRSQAPHTKINRSELPSKFGDLSIQEQVKNKSFIKILNGLGFKGELLKAFFYKRGRDTLTYRGDEIAKEDLEKADVKTSLFFKELELAHTKNSPE